VESGPAPNLQRNAKDILNSCSRHRSGIGLNHHADAGSTALWIAEIVGFTVGRAIRL
jgi:hypothetical protein